MQVARRKGIEVLFLSDPIDEYCVQVRIKPTPLCYNYELNPLLNPPLIVFFSLILLMSTACRYVTTTIFYYNYNDYNNYNN
jgi:hypothetical protein